jgi:hypothetical protein
MNMEEDAPPQEKTPVPASAETKKAKAPVEDLSVEICGSIEKQAGDRVKCTRISGNTYRINWWAPADLSGFDNPSMGGMLVTTHRVRKSKFLHVTKTTDGLLMKNVAAGPG